MNEADLNALMRPRKVCLCRNLSREDIEKAYDKGAKTLSQMVRATQATTGCGTCEADVLKIIRDKKNIEQEKTKLQRELPLDIAGFQSEP